MTYLDVFRQNASDFEKNALENFLNYLRIPTFHPNVNYGPCVSFFSGIAQALGLIFNVYYYYPDAPVIVITWQGSQPNLPSILLNSHMDVVAADDKQWRYRPFAADIDEEGNIHARGTQDTKGIGIQYLEAIRQLKNANILPRRNIHVTFVPDEEIGGAKGMEAFISSKEFKDLNVGFALDEGTPSEEDEFLVSYGEKSAHSIVIHCPGTVGHSSLLIKDTAGEKLNIILSKLYSLRAESERKIKGQLKNYGDSITVNVTQIQGGTEANVLPAEIKLTIDCRLPATMPLKQWEDMLDGWCKEAGDDVWREYLYKGIEVPFTNLDENNKFWVAFRETAKDMKLKLFTWSIPGTTDGRYLRSVGIPTVGFSPIRLTKFKLHQADEHLNVNIFLEGITIYSKLIQAISAV